MLNSNYFPPKLEKLYRKNPQIFPSLEARLLV